MSNPSLQLSQALVSSLNPELLLQDIITSIAQILQCDKALMLISDDASSGQLRVAAAYEKVQVGQFPAEADWQIIDVAHYPILVQTIRSKKQHMIDPQRAAAQLKTMVDLFDCGPCNNLLFQPLALNDQILGMLVLMAGFNREAFAAKDFEFCASWSEPIAQAMHNALQFQETKAQSAVLPLSVLESVTDGVLVSNADGRIQLVNAAAQRMLGAQQDELLDRPVSSILKQMPIFGGDGPAEADEEKGQQVTFPLNNRILQGSMSIISGDDDEFLGAVTILRDVTRIHHAEQAKEKFVGTISHELRTPLTAMKGYIELLNSGLTDPLTPSQREFVDVLQRNAERMVDLVNSLISVTQMQEGRMVPTHGHADLRQIINQVIRENRAFAHDHQVKLAAEFSDDVLVIQADPVQLHLVIERLVNNGIKYTPAGGKVSVSAKLQSGEAEETGFAVVSVADTGVGIPPEQQVHVFEQFYRLDERAIEVRAGGMGIGLAIVKTLVEAHGGRIWLESAVDQGSTFTFIIPVERRGSLPWMLKHTGDMLQGE